MAALSEAVLVLVGLLSKTVNEFVAGPVVIVTVVEVAEELVVDVNPQLPVTGVSVTVTATPDDEVNAFPYWSVGTVIVNVALLFLGTFPDEGEPPLKASVTPFESTATVCEPDFEEGLSVAASVTVVPAANRVTLGAFAPVATPAEKVTAEPLAQLPLAG